MGWLETDPFALTPHRMATALKNRPKRAGARKAAAGPKARSATALPSVIQNRSRINWINLALSGLLILLIVTVYGQVGSHPFVDYDDPDYVINNLHVQAGLTWSTITWAMTALEAGNWHPVTWLSHALDCQLFGLDPSGHHWSSVAFHCINTVLLFWLLWIATRARWQSFLVAALFALHPLNVESVAWIAERKNLVSTLFFLLALGAYGWYARRPGVARYLLLAVLFILGLGAKPMVITLPFVLLLLDFWPLQRIEGWLDPSSAFPVPQTTLSRLILEKLPLLALSAGSAVITIIAQRESVIRTDELPSLIRIENSLYAYGAYLWKMVWPAHLAIIYPHPGRTLPAWKPLLSLAIIIVTSIVAWKQRARRPYLVTGWLWFLGTAVPIIGIMQVGLQVIADRYAYLPLIGMFVIVVWGSSGIADDLGATNAARLAAGLAVLAVLAFVTYRQVGAWRSSVDLWSHAVEVTSNNSVAENNLANALFKLGRYQEGMEHIRKYVAMEPLDAFAHIRVAADDQDRGLLTDAAQEYTKALKANQFLIEHQSPGLNPKAVAITYANLGVTYLQLGDSAKAAQSGALALQTDSSAVQEMIQGMEQAVAARPAAGGYLRIGLLLQLFGQEAEAQQAFLQAQRLNPATAPRAPRSNGN
jgi:tetratricopeptide (TPR) repeat protein